MNDLIRLAERWEAIADNADPLLGTSGALIANTWRAAARDLRAVLAVTEPGDPRYTEAEWAALGYPIEDFALPTQASDSPEKTT